MDEEKQISPADQQNINRREIIKVLVASGGALTAAAFLPGRWAKPIVGAGVLPAHAQATCGNLTPVITQASAILVAGTTFVQIFFQDPANLISDDDLISFTITSPCGSAQGSRSFADTDWGAGIANFTLTTSPFNCNQGELCLRIIANGCSSNEFCTQISQT
jgi:hypothetical protein